MIEYFSNLIYTQEINFLLFLKKKSFFLVECEKQGHIFNSKYRLCFDLFTNTLPWNQSRDACQDIGGQLMMLDTVPKIEFMTGYIGHICKWRIYQQ